MSPPSRKAMTIGAIALSLIAVGVASAKGSSDPKSPTNPCGPGNMVNPAIARAVAQMRRATMTAAERAQLAALMARMAPCVPIECPDGYHRDGQTGACVLNTPDDPDPGFDPYDPGDDEPVIDDPVEPFECPAGEVENPAWHTRRLEINGMGLSGAALVTELSKMRQIPRCIPAPIEPPPADDDDDVDPWIKDFPEDNAFYQVKYGDIIGHGLAGMHWDAVTQNCLGRALFIAARDHLGMSNEAAQQWANARRKNTQLTNAIYMAIQCAAINDGSYGTWGYCGQVAIDKSRCPSSMRNVPGPHGRAVRPLAQHANNLQRLREGLPMARTVAILSPAQKGNGLGNAVASAQPGGKGSFPLLWLPGIDRQALADSNGKTLVFRDDQANPPDFIMDRGVTDYSGSTLTTYGCTSGGYKGQIDFG